MYDQESRNRLEEMLGYERWVLNELEDELQIFPRESGDTVIRDEEISEAIVSVSAARISQSRVEEIVERLYPLVFMASYKSIDMVIEWILEENGESVWRFSEKESAISELLKEDNLTLPSILDNEVGVFERVFSLYGNLMDCRHSIVHSNEFEVRDGELHMECEDGVQYRLDSTELFSLAKSSTAIADALLQNTLTEEFERELKTYLDNLDEIHEMDNYNLAAPWAGTIIYHAEAVSEDPFSWEIDLDLVRKADDSTGSTAGYTLDVIGENGGDVVKEWEIPSDQLPNQGVLELSEELDDFAEFVIEL